MLRIMALRRIENPGTRLPWFELPSSDRSGSDSYRLRDGHVEFRPAGGHWRRLTDLDVKLHFTLDTPVGRWLATLTSVAEVTRELAD
jgi:hypothetical protein